MLSAHFGVFLLVYLSEFVQLLAVDEVCTPGNAAWALSMLAVRSMPDFRRSSNSVETAQAQLSGDTTGSATLKTGVVRSMPDFQRSSSGFETAHVTGSAPRRTGNVLQHETAVRIESSLAATRSRPAKMDVADKQQRWFEEWNGKNAPLDEEGYDSVASLEADEDMELFIRRLIKAMDMRIIDMGGLHGVVPYYSGTKVSQSFSNLQRDLKRGLKKHGKYGPWLEMIDEE